MCLQSCDFILCPLFNILCPLQYTGINRSHNSTVIQPVITRYVVQTSECTLISLCSDKINILPPLHQLDTWRIDCWGDLRLCVRGCLRDARYPQGLDISRCIHKLKCRLVAYGLMYVLLIRYHSNWPIMSWNILYILGVDRCYFLFVIA